MRSLPLKRAKKVSLTDSVIQQLVEMIQIGSLRPGQKLPSERELMEMMGVGRTPVREALQALALADLIEIRPGYGSTVKQAEFAVPEPVEGASATIRKVTLEHLAEARQMLEGEIAAAAAVRATEDDFERMRSILDRCERAIEHRQTPHKLAAEFHMAIAESTCNTVVIKLMHSILGSMVEGGRQRHVTGYSRWELAAHREVLDVLRIRNPELARETMKRHIAESASRIVFPGPDSNGRVDPAEEI